MIFRDPLDFGDRLCYNVKVVKGESGMARCFGRVMFVDDDGNTVNREGFHVAFFRRDQGFASYSVDGHDGCWEIDDVDSDQYTVRIDPCVFECDCTDGMKYDSFELIAIVPSYQEIADFGITVLERREPEPEPEVVAVYERWAKLVDEVLEIRECDDGQFRHFVDLVLKDVNACLRMHRKPVFKSLKDVPERHALLIALGVNAYARVAESLGQDDHDLKNKYVVVMETYNYLKEMFAVNLDPNADL